MKNLIHVATAALLLVSCTSKKGESTLVQSISDSPAIEGKKSYLGSPYVTAGDRVYMVGHQDGSFPELGWHIKGEMGGIWNHPIKLMDGFQLDLILDGETVSLEKADRFINYPFGNKHLYNLEQHGLKVERFQFVPDEKEVLIVQFSITNNSETNKDISVKFMGSTDLRPTWLGERTNMIDSGDIDFDPESDVWVVKDFLNSWYTMFGADRPSALKELDSSHYQGKGFRGSLIYDLSLKAGTTERINFAIAGAYDLDGSDSAKERIYANYLDIMEDPETWIPKYLAEKKARYEDLAGRTKLTIPDKDIEQAFEWVKYNCDWLVRTVPEIGSGIGAGIPDYPWWFGVDSEYALQGYMAIGQTEPVYNTIKLLDSVSEAVNGNGKIIHEMSTNGAVFNPGNINETPQFASLIWKVYQWNEDKEFLQKYYPTIKKGLDWLMTEKDADGNLFPDGFGMMEIHGLDSEMIDVAAYSYKAFKDASFIADALGDYQMAQQYYQTAEKLSEKINTQFWSEEFNSYADFIGTDQQALKLIEDAIVRADTLNKPWAVEELKQTRDAIMKNPSATPRPFVLHHNWVVNTPMEVGLAGKDKAEKALATAEKYVNPFGVFVTGIDRDESAGSDDGSFKGSKIFSYTGAVMTLPTGVQIVSENNYGRPDMALNYLKRMTRTFSYALPGSIYEVSPDYGMVTQAWNVYGYAVPIVEQFFGITPNAANKKVSIRPQMPSSWNNASLEKVLVGDNAISIFFSEKEGRKIVEITQSLDDWQLEFQFPEGAAKITTLTEGIDVSTNEETGVSVVKTYLKSIQVSYQID
ncbi:MAG: glycogen debranching protein [Flavobacterium sp.]|nr:MAG: glycogen debranching protein [Flavobacterium sp.]